MEDLFLTGRPAPTRATPTPRSSPAPSAAASTARATSATRPRPDWPPSVRTCSRRSPTHRCHAPQGYQRLLERRTTPCTARRASTSVRGAVDSQPGSGGYGGTGGVGGAPGCGSNGGKGGNGGNGDTAAGHGGNGGNGGNGACPPEEWVGGVWLTSAGAPTSPPDTPPCNGTRRRRRQGRQGRQRRGLDSRRQRRQRRQRFARGARPEGHQGGEWLAGADVRRRQTDAAASARCRSRDRVVRPGPGLVAFVMLVSTLVFASWCGSAQASPPTAPDLSRPLDSSLPLLPSEGHARPRCRRHPDRHRSQAGAPDRRSGGRGGDQGIPRQGHRERAHCAGGGSS